MHAAARASVTKPLRTVKQQLQPARQTWQTDSQYGGEVSPYETGDELKAALFLAIRTERRQDGQPAFATPADSAITERLRSDLLRAYAKADPVPHRPQVPILVAFLSHGSALAAAQMHAVSPRTVRQWIQDFLEDCAGVLVAERRHIAEKQIREVERDAERKAREELTADRLILDAYQVQCWQICGRKSHGGPGSDTEGQGAGCGHCPRRWAVRE